MSSTADVVICGAGISGIATAYHLAVTYGVKNVVIVDERPPLSLTRDKSSEAYRNWWPDEMMVRLMNRSTDWLERWALESNKGSAARQVGDDPRPARLLWQVVRVVVRWRLLPQDARELTGPAL